MRYDSQVNVRLGHLKNNYELLKNLAPQNEVLFMIKADAYGNGIERIYDYAFSKLNITSFGVASLAEAVLLRHNFPKYKTNIYVFSDLSFQYKDAYKSYKEFNILPVIFNLNQLDFFIKNLNTMPLCLKFNTGMNRLGIDVSEIDKVSTILTEEKLNIFHLMTHFASSYQKYKVGNNTDRQYKEFLAIKNIFHKNGITVEHTSISNSGAIEQNFGLEESFIRPGLMMYGPYSFGNFQNEEIKWKAKNISSLETKIIQNKLMKRGMPIGYGSHVLDKDYQVVALPLGYGDGILTYFSGAKLNIEGQEAKVLGRVNMDLTLLGFEPDAKNLEPNTPVKLWTFEQESLMDFSRAVKTIPYQIMCAINKRVPRIYQD